jgi:hypothetical protein
MRPMRLMLYSSKLLLAVLTGVTALVPFTPTWADAPPEPSQSTPNKPIPTQPLPSTPQADQSILTARRFEGEVEKYLLNREGIVDGLSLTNGVQAKFPPQLSSNLMEIVEVGDSVIVIGSGGMPNSLGQEVQAESIMNRDTERTVSTMVNYSNISVEGTAQRWLVGKQGEIRGVLLSEGAQVQFPPHLGNQLSLIAKPGARVQAQGIGVRNDYGQVVEASTLTIDGRVVDVSAPAPKPREKRSDRPAPATLLSPDAARATPRPVLPLK